MICDLCAERLYGLERLRNDRGASVLRTGDQHKIDGEVILASKRQAEGAVQNIRLVAVVVTHNRLAKLGTTLERLGTEVPSALDAVIVVDNQSSDGTPEWLAEWEASMAGRALVHLSKTNLGGAGGFALGMKLAAESFDPDWIVVMDDDARPSPGALTTFLGNNHAGWDAVAAAVYYPGGVLCEMNRPSCNPFWSWRGVLRLVRYVLAGKGRDGFHIPRSAYDERVPTAIDAASFVGLFVSRHALALVGFPDARLFIYGDDVLYTLALRELGGMICFDPRIHFEHDFSTLDAEHKRFVPLWKSYYHHRNLLIVYRRSAGLFFWPALLVVLPKWFLKARHHAGERRAYLRLLFRAVRDGLSGRLDASLTEVRALEN